MNLALLKKNRNPQPGDIFAMLPPDGLYLFGRCISRTAVVGAPPNSIPNCSMIYVYSSRSKQKEDIPHLSPESLLLPPMLTNTLPWSCGYFERIARLPLQPEDLLEQHCFEDVVFGGYLDEQGMKIAGPVEPIGVSALKSYRTIDDAISKALGIPLAPD